MLLDVPGKSQIGDRFIGTFTGQDIDQIQRLARLFFLRQIEQRAPFQLMVQIVGFIVMHWLKLRLARIGCQR